MNAVDLEYGTGFADGEGLGDPTGGSYGAGRGDFWDGDMLGAFAYGVAYGVGVYNGAGRGEDGRSYAWRCDQ